ncbi:MAG TPA: prepilin-type N-terminal cleavage/methylation domain-containing protein [Lacunisphaera sp.]|nr:prepilin-type N-terminal cleavage/methylation domain-containing protein [Lacunisphaera sp.]
MPTISTRTAEEEAPSEGESCASELARDTSRRSGSLASSLPRDRNAFTLLELLTVLAIIGILAALLFPGLRAARVAANKAATKVRFGQWAAVLESFRAEYGYYPVLHGSNLVNPPGQNTAPSTLHLFHDVLAARRRDGSALPALAGGTDPRFPEAQNRKLIAFYSFASAELTGDGAPQPNLLRDAFDNTEIAVLVDRDLDGVIKPGADFANLPTVGGMAPASADIPATGIHAGVIFYVPGPGATPATPDFIFSWK